MAAKKKAAKKKAAKRKAAPKKRAPVSDPSRNPNGGRPTAYTPELADMICFRLSTGESLLRISRDDDMPHRFTVSRWLLGQNSSQIDPDELERFRANYDRARLDFEALTFERLLLVDEDTHPEAANVSRAKLWSDNAKWSLARMNRAKYGDKADLNIGGQGDAPPVQTEQAVDLTSLTPEERKELQRIAQRTITGKD